RQFAVRHLANVAAGHAEPLGKLALPRTAEERFPGLAQIRSVHHAAFLSCSIHFVAGSTGPGIAVLPCSHRLMVARLARKAWGAAWIERPSRLRQERSWARVILEI